MVSFSERNIEIYQKRKQGVKFSDLGLEYNLTNARVGQIVRKMQGIINTVLSTIQSNNIEQNSEPWKRLTENDIDFIQRLRGSIAKVI